jgi:glycosyltransferase involved in cell wall biosynthesis
MSFPVDRPRIVFVGGFDDRHVKGGQIFACKSLVASPLSAKVRWALIDSSMASLPPPPIWSRMIGAARRVFLFARHLGTRPDAAIIFSSAGASFAEKGLMVLMARLCGTPALFCPRSGLIIDMVERSRFAACAVRTVVRAADQVICQGEAWAAFYQKLGGGNIRTKVITNAIALGEYPGSPVPLHAAGHGLFLGWMEPNKGIYDLLGAAELLASEGAEFTLTFAGSGGHLEDFRRKAAAGPAARNIRVVGWVDAARKRQLLADSSFLVLASYREGLPNVVLEAMASARAVIVTRVGAVPEVVTDGVNGLLVPPGDVPALANALRRVICSPEQAARMGAAGRTAARARHDLSRQWLLWSEAIESSLRRRYS